MNGMRRWDRVFFIGPFFRFHNSTRVRAILTLGEPTQGRHACPKDVDAAVAVVAVSVRMSVRVFPGPIVTTRRQDRHTGTDGPTPDRP